MYFVVVFLVPQSAVMNTSSSEDEARRSASLVIRRRRLRKNTTSNTVEPEVKEDLESGLTGEEEADVDMQQEEQAEVPAALDARMQGQGSSILNRCILLAIIVAFSIGFGHYYGEMLTTMMMVIF